jgi:integrase
MAKYTWFTTKHKGLRYREHPTRKHGIRKDRFYQYRMMVDGRRVQESFGWMSEGWTENHCLVEIAKLKQARITGEGETTLKERRARAEAKRQAEQLELLTLGQVWSEYLPQAKADRGETSLVREESLYQNWIEPALGDKPIKQIAAIHLEKLKSNMAKQGKSARTIQYVLAVIRQVFNYAKRHNLFNDDNPVSKVKKPSEDNRRVRFLSRDEADLLLDELKKRSQALHDQALLSLHTGMRAGEIFNLRWKDIDFDRAMITLWDTKNKSTRTSFMTEAVRDMLLRRQPLEADPQALVFPGRNGVRIKQISESFNRAVNALGYNRTVDDPRQKVVFHTLRHTFASWLVESGTDLYTVKELMGHKDLKMTQRYSHLAPDTLQAAIKNFDLTLSKEPAKAKVTPITAAG